MSVRRPLAIKDEFCLLEYYSCIAHARSRMNFHGMLLMDAFRAFDYDRNGMLSAEELYGGFWIFFFIILI